MFLLVWANSYDSADGQLARLTGQFPSLAAYSTVLPAMYGL